jgi:hypothetical protein
MRKFDLHEQISSLPKTLVDDAFNKIDQSYGDVLTNGWSTSYTDVYGSSVTSTGPDGLALFSAVHSNDTTTRTYSNLISDGVNNDPILSRAAIVKSVSNAGVYVDPNGLNRPIMLDTLIVGQANWDLAERLVFSPGVVGTANVDINPVKSRIRKIVTWPRLDTRTGGTDTSAYWFLADSRRVGESLKSKFAQRPEMAPPEVVYANKNWEYSIDYFYVHGIGYQAYIRGSRGTA